MIHDYLRTALAFAFVLGVLVSFHELGHYLAARWRGVHVEVFSLGFGPALFKWRDRTGTEWRICPIPLGGYVRPHGFEDPDDATEEQKAAWIPGRTFHDKPVGSRALVILAGPVFNFILAFVLFTVLFASTGEPRVRDEVAAILPGSAAAVAGVQPGDVIHHIGTRDIKSVEDVLATVTPLAGAHTTLGVTRHGQEMELPITIGAVTESKGGASHGQLGVTFAVERGQPMPLGSAVVAGAKATWHTTVQTLDGLWQIISGQHSAREMGGPLKIAQLSGQVAQYGFASLLSFMALLSVNLGLINLFPVPLLDGGRLVFYAIEAVRGRPVSKRVQEISFQAGFAVLAGLFLFSTFNDLSGFGLFRWVASLAG
ncbi:RIP metalloprotease RseP [Acetobacter sp. TBRC 12305]|uniref:Zinc metalloprotease n=1 Tax=Acetobacter garciniae TaxID=2817435 RepID=A0A939HHT9_9PROT|nr:RIP metalloprotease RseP [Acetobacter garciniae]MBO1323672.1 RIP metalloprotease RseP [Acetobacter garciniae]MBX0343361.1 RIP metalloprotease RseP [Acetobacter garciniae]